MTQINIEFSPLPWQKQVLDDFKRYNIIIAHRGSGKTYLTTKLLTMSAISDNSRLPVYAYIMPQLAQARKVALDTLVEGVEDISRVNYQEGSIEFTHNKAKIFILGLSEADRLRGLHCNGIVIDETADVLMDDYSKVILPTTNRKQGWVFAIGTPKMNCTLSKLYEVGKANPELYQAKWIDIYNSGVFTEAQIEAIKKDYQDRGDFGSFEQEYECHAHAQLDKFYFRGHLDNARASNRIGDYPFILNKPVSLVFDIGADGTAYWAFQQVNGQVRIFDFYQITGSKLDTVFNRLHTLDYPVTNVYLPWDSNQERVNSDFNIAKQFQMNNYRVRVLPRTNVSTGIMEASTLMRYCVFNESTCKIGLDYLMNYAARVDKKTGQLLSTPLHDINSHAADAFRYCALAVKDPGNIGTSLQQNITVESWDILDNI